MTRPFFTCLVVCCSLTLFSCLKMESPGHLSNELEDTTQNSGYSIQEYAAVSLQGKPYYAPKISARQKFRKEEELSQALEFYNRRPDSLDYIVDFGMRLSALHMYKEAIQIYSDGIAIHVHSFELYRYRGENHIISRDFDRAISDLEKAAFYAREADVQMERIGSGDRGIPRTSVQFNIWFHLGFAYYLKGNYDKSVSAYKKCLTLANNDDMLVSVTCWLYMTYMRLGNIRAAKDLLLSIENKMNVIEYMACHKILLMYKGVLSPNELFDTLKSQHSDTDLIYGYGVGNWYLFNGDTEMAYRIFDIMMKSPYWPSIGFLAAEVEITNRLQEQ